MLAREGDECLSMCKGDDGDYFLATLGAGAVPVQAARWAPSLMLAHRATAHPAP